MRRFDASIQADIGKFQRGKLYLENVKLDAILENGALDVRDLALDARSGRLRSRASLEPAEGGAVTSVELVARDPGIRAVRYQPGPGEDRRRVDLDLTLVGDDLRTMLSASTGILLFEMRPAESSAETRFLQALYGDVLQQILSVINPFYKQNTETRASTAWSPRLPSTPGS